MASATRPDVSRTDLAELCRDLLGAELLDVLFESGYSSAVFGVRVVGGDCAVIKLRPWRDRLVGCAVVQAHLSATGFPCPRPLVPPIVRGTLAVSAEELVPGGMPLRGGNASAPLAALLALLVDRAPSPSEVPGLKPEYGFLRWQDAGDPLWPPPTDVSVDLNRIDAPWIDGLAEQVLKRLAEVDLPAVIGHGDWWSENIRWDNAVVVSVDDWDSTVALPEPAIVGAAAALFADGESTLSQTAEFIESYGRASGRLLTSEIREVAWATGLWARLFDAKKALAVGFPASAQRLKLEAAERAQHAGLRRM